MKLCCTYINKLKNLTLNTLQNIDFSTQKYSGSFIFSLKYSVVEIQLFWNTISTVK